MHFFLNGPWQFFFFFFFWVYSFNVSVVNLFFIGLIQVYVIVRYSILVDLSSVGVSSFPMVWSYESTIWSDIMLFLRIFPCWESYLVLYVTVHYVWIWNTFRPTIHFSLSLGNVTIFVLVINPPISFFWFCLFMRSWMILMCKKKKIWCKKRLIFLTCWDHSAHIII